MVRKQLMIALMGLAVVASPAFAAKVTRHCVDPKDKHEIAVTAAPGKSESAACKAAGGTWVKMKTTSKTTTKTKSK